MRQTFSSEDRSSTQLVGQAGVRYLVLCHQIMLQKGEDDGILKW